MRQIDLKLLEDAIEQGELKQEEMAELCGITRQSLYSWRKGKAASSDFLADRAEKICKSILTAVSAERLPLRDVSPASRMLKIKIALVG